MANLQVKDIDDRLYEALRAKAKSENRSISQEVITIIERYLSNPNAFFSNPVSDFIHLSGSWDDERSTEQIISDIKKSRKNSARFGDKNVIFD